MLLLSGLGALPKPCLMLLTFFGKAMGCDNFVVLPCRVAYAGVAVLQPGVRRMVSLLVIIIGLLGALFGGFRIEFPAFNLSGMVSAVNGKNIFPLLFITVACGACSGFHGIVSSGTTSKQLKRESDSVPIAYGAMLLEGLVAVLAIVTVMMLPKGDSILKSDPNFTPTVLPGI